MFYKLQDPDPRSWQYAWKDLSFAGFESAVCPSCGRENAAAAFRGEHCLIAEGGPRWPDRLPFTGAGGPMLLLSDRAAELLREHGITGIGASEPVRVCTQEHDAVVPLPESAPGYRRIEVSGRIDLDLPKMSMKKKRHCAVCGGFEWNRQRMPKLQLDESSWDGSDLCRVTSIPGYVICTEAVVSLVNKHRLKGFVFEPL